MNNYSFSWLIDSEDLLEKWNVASNITENNTSAIIPTMCQPLRSKFVPEATIPIMATIFTLRFIILPLLPSSSDNIGWNTDTNVG